MRRLPHPQTIATRNCKSLSHRFLLLLLLTALGVGVACSKDTPAATSKPPVTVDPDMFETDHPELFKTAKAETRAIAHSGRGQRNRLA